MDIVISHFHESVAPVLQLLRTVTLHPCTNMMTHRVVLLCKDSADSLLSLQRNQEFQHFNIEWLQLSNSGREGDSYLRSPPLHLTCLPLSRIRHVPCAAADTSSAPFTLCLTTCSSPTRSHTNLTTFQSGLKTLVRLCIFFPLDQILAGAGGWTAGRVTRAEAARAEVAMDIRKARPCLTNFTPWPQ